MDILSWILTGTLVLVVALFFHLRRFRGKIEGTGLPIVKPVLCFGSPPFMFHKIVGHYWYQEKFRELGKTFARYDGVNPAIYSIDPEFIKEVTVKQFDNFTDTFAFDLKPEHTTLDTAKGDTWRGLRKFMTPTFTTGKLKSLASPIDKIANDTLDYLENKHQGNPEMDMIPIIKGFAFDVIAKITFGMDTRAHRGEDQEFANLAMSIVEGFDGSSLTNVIFFNIANHFPIIVEKLGLFGDAADKITKLTHDVIAQRQKNNTPDIGDFADRLREFKKVASPPITDSMIDAQGMIFLLAGLDTIAMTLGAMIYALATNPEIQEIIHQEIVDEISSDEVNHENVSKLAYLEAAICETLRMYPPSNDHVRVCTKDATVQGMPIRKGVHIHMPTYAAHYNPDFFPEPNVFRPERFLKDNADDLIPYTWRPFGSGLRVCVGQRFAMLEVKIFMAKFLSKYKLIATSSTKMDVPLGSGVFFLVNISEMVAKIEKR